MQDVLYSSVEIGIFPISFLCSLVLSPVLFSVSLLFLSLWFHSEQLWDYCSWLFFVLGACVFSLLFRVVSSLISAVFPALCPFSFPALFFMPD